MMVRIFIPLQDWVQDSVYKIPQNIQTMKKVRFLTFFLKKFETGIKIAFFKNTTLELDVNIRKQTKNRS